MSNIKYNISAFTLVELMIVIAIIGILSSIAIPSYQTYAKRARAAKVITVIRKGLIDTAEYYQINGKYPESILGGYAKQGINKTGSYAGLTDIRSIWYRTGTNVEGGGGNSNFKDSAWVQIRLSNNLNLTATGATVNASDSTDNNGFGILLRPTKNGQIEFFCGPYRATDLDVKYLPANCRTIISTLSFVAPS